MSMREIVEAMSEGEDVKAVGLLAELGDEEIAGKISEMFNGKTFGVVFATTLMHLGVQIRMSPSPELAMQMAITLLAMVVAIPKSPMEH